MNYIGALLLIFFQKLKKIFVMKRVGKWVLQALKKIHAKNKWPPIGDLPKIRAPSKSPASPLPANNEQTL